MDETNDDDVVPKETLTLLHFTARYTITGQTEVRILRHSRAEPVQHSTSASCGGVLCGEGEVHSQGERATMLSNNAEQHCCTSGCGIKQCPCLSTSIYLYST